MSPRLALAVSTSALASLALAGPAAAKELTRVTICGRGDVCATITDPERLSVVPMGGTTTVAPPARQPYYWMTLAIEHGDEAVGGDVGVVYYLREANALGANGLKPGRLVWFPIFDPKSRALMREVTRGIQPHPAPPHWPFELKSPYRVIPDDEFLDAQPSSVPEPVTASRENGRSAFWFVGAVVLGPAAAALLLRRLASHQARHERGQALPREDAADALGDRELDAPPV